MFRRPESVRNIGGGGLQQNRVPAGGDGPDPFTTPPSSPARPFVPGPSCSVHPNGGVLRLWLSATSVTGCSLEGALVRRARAGQLFVLLLIPALAFGVDSTPRMGEWVDGWDAAIWDDFSSGTCSFPVGDMERPLSLTYCPPVHLV